MKIAFTTSGNELNAPLDRRFGRAPKFLIYDLDANTFDVIDNKRNMVASQGAGIEAAGAIVLQGVKGLVTGNCGPKAFRVLRSAGVRIFNADAPTVSLALEQYRAGLLTEAVSANVNGHWK